MPIGKRRKIEKPQRLQMSVKFLNGIRDGYCQVAPCKKHITDGLTDLHRNMLFSVPALHVPTEIDYLVAQTIEGMGYDQDECRIAVYEGRHEFQLEIFPPDGV